MASYADGMIMPRRVALYVVAVCVGAWMVRVSWSYGGQMSRLIHEFSLASTPKEHAQKIRRRTSTMSNRVCHFKLVLLGDTAVGKSCLVVRFVRDEFFEFQEPTIGGKQWHEFLCVCSAQYQTPA
jgi:hypothetical protein